ncbi:MAG: MATE family efflux transporter [Parvularculaceae bacterium]|nr:MATE family efflux transporter [Parvularculaceae bacterium]
METPFAAQRGSRAAWRDELAALLALGVPMALTQIVQYSVLTVDVLMIGRLGPEPLAASSLGLVIFFGAWLIGFGPAMAVSPMVSQALGADENNVDDVRLSVRMGLWAIALMAPVVALLFFLTEGIALALGQPEGLAHLAGPYVIALAPGWMFAMGTLILRNFLAAIGETRWPLVIVIGTTLSNAGLNWLLIYGNWGFPRLELVGAGVASSLVNTLGFVALVAFIRVDKRARRFELFRDALTPDWPRFREIYRLGWPIGVAVAFEGMLFNACVFLMGRIGVAEVAAYQVALNVASIAFMAPLGLSMAGGVRVGLAAGAGDWLRVRRAAALTIGLAIAAIMAVAIPVILFPEVVAGLYLNRDDPKNAAVIALVAEFLVIAAAFMLFDATQVASAQALRGLKDVRSPMVITGIAYWAIGFPTAAWLGLNSPLGAVGVWWGLLLGLFAAASMLAGRLYLLTAKAPRIVAG